MFKAMSAKAGSSKRRKKRSEGFTKEETESRNYFFVFFFGCVYWRFKEGSLGNIRMVCARTAYKGRKREVSVTIFSTLIIMAHGDGILKQMRSRYLRWSKQLIWTSSLRRLVERLQCCSRGELRKIRNYYY